MAECQRRSTCSTDQLTVMGGLSRLGSGEGRGGEGGRGEDVTRHYMYMIVNMYIHTCKLLWFLNATFYHKYIV